MALILVLGICLLLFCNQLHDGWLRRCDPPLEVADVGSTREHYRRSDVRRISKSAVCDRNASYRP